MGDVLVCETVLLGHHEPEAAEHGDGSLVLVEADAGLGRPFLARLRDEGMAAVPRGARGIQ